MNTGATAPAGPIAGTSDPKPTYEELVEALDHADVQKTLTALDDYIENDQNPLVTLGKIGFALLRWGKQRRSLLTRIRQGGESNG